MKPILLVPLASSLFVATSLCQSAWAAGCGFMISKSQSSLNETGHITIRPATTAQSFMPDQSDLFLNTQDSPVYYWGKNQNNVSKTIIFEPEATAFTADSNNPKGWLVDSAVPGLYFTLSVALPPTDGMTWGNFSPAMPIFLSNNPSINQSTPADGRWGCANAKNDTYFASGTMTFSLSFYTTSAFNPALAAGKQLLVTEKRAGTLENSQDSGGEFEIYLQGPLTISTAGCGAFSADEQVDLGAIPVGTLRSKPDDEHNKTPFQITLQNCYAKPTLVINLATNQSQNNLLTNNRGNAQGVGVGLGYTTATNASRRLDLTTPTTIASEDLGYNSYSGNGILNMFAILGVTDKSALSPGNVDIPAVITLTNP
ncbi:hypothetical protein [Superficieibacter electus]|nr:hypothetical protein [Superficieibacter electus]